MAAKKKTLDAYLMEVFKLFVSIKDDDFKKSQKVFTSVFKQVKQKMAQQCDYFKDNSREVMFAGSVYDGSKISKMDEFDMDIAIRLPVDYKSNGDNGIIIENEEPGYVKLKILKAFDRLDKTKECHKLIPKWLDSENYFLQSEFRRWMHSILQKAVNSMEGRVTVGEVVYLLTFREAGPAYTLNIRNDINDKPFKLDVDVVPVIKFMFPRVPDGYSNVSRYDFKCKKWLVVPKPNKQMSGTLQERCWRLSFHEQEREIMRDRKSMKMTYRLLKKLRDVQGMNIASYYIKTLFLWKVYENDAKYWEQQLSVLFQTMVEKLYIAIMKKNIPFFWNSSQNLIERLDDNVQKEYIRKLREVLAYITVKEPDKLVTYLLTKDEIEVFKNTDFFLKHNNDLMLQQDAEEHKISELTLFEQVRALSTENKEKDKEIADLVAKIHDLDNRVSRLEGLLSVAFEQQSALIQSRNYVSNLKR